MRLTVRYSGWHVDDGDAPIAVGEVWAPTKELLRPRPTPTGEVTPDLVRVETHPAARLDPRSTGEGVYDLAGEVVEQALGWSVVAVGGLRFAVSGDRRGWVQGPVLVGHDSHLLPPGPLRDAVTQPGAVLRIDREVWPAGEAGGEAGGRVAGQPLRRDTVRSTHDHLPAEGAGEITTFFVELDFR